MRDLERMFETQAAFTKHYLPENATEEEKKRFVLEIAVLMVSEVKELLDSMGDWKIHRKEGKPLTVSGITEESIDIFKYLMNIWIAFDLSPQDVVREFERKSMVVSERYKWEQTLATISSGDRVAAIDLDGVLAKYPENWIEYVNKNNKSSYTMEDFSSSSVSFVDMPRRDYYNLKHKFRDEGFESLYLEAFEDASEFTLALRNRGYKIVILSARPYRQYKRIQGDTIQWMKKHRILYDAFIWDAEKHMQIVRNVPNVNFIVEDNPVIAEEVSALGYRVYLRKRPYNGLAMTAQNVKIVNKLEEIIEDVDRGTRVLP